MNLTPQQARLVNQLVQAGVLDPLFAPGATFEVVCIRADGSVRWQDRAHNVVTTEGKILLLNVMFGATAKPSWFVGLISGVSFTSVAVGDTAAQINGTNAWREANTGGGTNTPTYSNANRPGLTFGSAAANGSNGRISTSSPSAFNINAGTNVTTRGLFAITNNTIGGTTGTLFNAVLFTGGDKIVSNGDTLNVNVQFDAN